MSTQEKSFIVIARDGYNVLLNINDQTMVVDCYNPVNLSKMFLQEFLDQCVSLQAHLRDGNLIMYDGGELKEDPNAVQINKLNEVADRQIHVLYTQKSARADAFNIELETAPEVTQELREKIDEGIEKNREAIIKQDESLLSHLTSSIEPNKSLTEAFLNEGHSLTEGELNFKVTMDVDNDEFERVQEQGRKKLEEEQEASERVANAEIEKRSLENKE